MGWLRESALPPLYVIVLNLAAGPQLCRDMVSPNEAEDALKMIRQAQTSMRWLGAGSRGKGGGACDAPSNICIA